MKRLLIGCLFFWTAFALVGCMTMPGQRGSRFLPWNWFSSDSSGKVAKAETGIDRADALSREAAHRFAEATRLAIEAEKARQLAAAGIVSREVVTAADYSARTVSALDVSEGFLTFDVKHELEEMVRRRNSELEAERARGDKALAAVDKLATKGAEDKVAWQAKLAAAQAKVGQEQQRALVAEEKWHRLWFWVWACAIGAAVVWIGGQVLTRLAAANPAFAAPAAIFNKLAAPALHSAWEKVADVPQRVGAFMAEVRKDAPAIADQVESYLDGHLDLQHKKLAAAAATTAGAPPS